MKIKKQKQNLIINTDGKDIVILRENNIDLSDKTVVVNLSNSIVDDKSFINVPGEYEIADVLFNVFSVGKNLDKPEIISIDSNEDIKILYILSSVDAVDKTILERLPDTNVLIVEIDAKNISKKLQMINDIEPDNFIPLVDREVVPELSKEMGITSIEEIATLNISQKDFTEESSELKVFLLKNN